MCLREVRLLPRGSQVLMMGLGPNEEVLLKARLSAMPAHPRAVISVLEGLALWGGRSLPVALGVTRYSSGSIEALLPQGSAWCSPLVDLLPVDFPRARRRRLDGVGDFRAMHQLRLPGFP